ncbi:hypothetical protein K1X76_05280 [bacterium]|nr:hypothetical protein [bacterium]
MNYNKIAAQYGLKLKEMHGDINQGIVDIVKTGKIVGVWKNENLEFFYENSIITDDNIKEVLGYTTFIKTIHDVFDYFVKGKIAALILDDHYILELPSVVSLIFGEMESLTDTQKNPQSLNTSACDFSEIAKGNPFVTNLWGKLLAFRGEISKAGECFREAVEMERNFSEPYSNLGALLWKAGKQREAFLLFCEALIKNPYSQTAQMNFFDAGYELCEYKAILTIIDHVACDETPIEFDHHRAICHFKLGERDKALGIVNTILEKNPVDTEALELKTTFCV